METRKGFSSGRPYSTRAPGFFFPRLASVTNVSSPFPSLQALKFHFRNEVILLRSEGNLLQSEVILLRSEVILLRNEVILLRSEAILLRNEVEHDNYWIILP